MAENKWVTGVVTPINGVVTLFKTGRGPSCNAETETKLALPQRRMGDFD